ncbi:MAG: hypothetical protein L0Y75_08865 [Acidobacteria bacterium]|nr:hypothetical protein [Acidobacteriota bacterium]
MTENTSNDQPLIDQRLSRIENMITEFAASQQQLSSLILSRLESIETDLGSVKADLTALKPEVSEIKEEAKLRDVDLRERIDLNRDKLGVMQRELNQLIKDLTNPPFTTVNTR